MDVLDTLTPFCSGCRQFFGFISDSARILQISSDNVHSVFFLGRPSFRLYSSVLSHCVAWRGILESSIRNTCPSHLSLLSFMMSSNFHNPVCFLSSSFLTLSFHVIPNSLRWNLCSAASSFFICKTGSGHNSATYSSVEMTSDLSNCYLIFTGRFMLLLFQTFCKSSKDTWCFPDSHIALFVAVPSLESWCRTMQITHRSSKCDIWWHKWILLIFLSINNWSQWLCVFRRHHL